MFLSPRSHTQLPSSYFRPSLIELCVPILARNFLQRPTFGSLPPAIRAQVVAQLPLDLPLDLCAKLITEDEYWKRRANVKWKNCDISAHGRSWRQLYFERFIATSLESFDSTCGDENELKKLLILGAPFVHNLEIYQLPSHLSASLIFSTLGRELSSLKLEFGWRNARMHYNPHQFGMKISDCLSLSASFSIATTLTDLNLSCNLLNDEKVKLLVRGMLQNPILVQLDLSHNNIGDEGIYELSKFLSSKKCVLGGLNLGDNQIQTDGAKSLAEVLRNNIVLTSMTLRYNRLGDEGGQAILEALQNNSALKMQEGIHSPKYIDLQLCEVGGELEEAIFKLLQNKNSEESCCSVSRHISCFSL